MIEVKVSKNSILMRGHAGYHENGVDMVCAAASALTCNLINSLRNLTSDKIRDETENGFAIVEWEELSEDGKLLVDSWFLGLTEINQEYGCIKFV